MSTTKSEIAAADQRAHDDWIDGEGAEVVTSTGIWHAAILHEREEIAKLLDNITNDPASKYGVLAKINTRCRP